MQSSSTEHAPAALAGAAAVEDAADDAGADDEVVPDAGAE
jgi:hypothetical protein